MRKMIRVLLLSSLTGLLLAPVTTGSVGNVCAAETNEQVSALSLSMSKSSGCYDSAFSLEISCDGAKAVYYTTDGSNPISSDSRVTYTGPISITDRKNDANVVAAVDPVLFDSAYATYDDGKWGDVYSAPKDSEVDKATVIKAVAVDASGVYTKVVTNTYFVGSMTEHVQGIKESCEATGVPLSIMSISMDYDDLFDYDKGIYVKGRIFDEAASKLSYISPWRAADTARDLDANYKQRGSGWERAAHIDYLESDGSDTNCMLQQDCGIRIQGNYSRSDYQKGFRLYARESYGEKNFKYTFFGNDAINSKGEVISKFKKLTLRNGGNSAFNAKFNDQYWQSLITDMNCDTQASRVCVVYLNGEYWGIYILQEDYNSSYFENTYGVDKDSVVVYKGDAETYEIGYKLDEGELPAGESDESYYFKELNEFFASHSDLKSQADYEEFEKLVDVESVKDYFAVQIWINNKWDWPGKNWSFWKTTTVNGDNSYADGRWRLCFYDLDFGGVSGGSDAWTNTVKEDNYKDYGLLDMNTSNPVVLSFAYLMSNPDFRAEFETELKGLSDKNFEKTKALAALDKFKDIYSPLYNQFFTRYFGTEKAESFANDAVNGGYSSYKCISDFLSKRSSNIDKMIKWIDDFYATHTVYKSEDEDEDDGKDEEVEKSKFKSVKVTAKKGTKVIKVAVSEKNAKVTVTLKKKIIVNGKKKVKSITKTTGKNGAITIKLSQKLTKNTKITVKVKKSGFVTKTKKVVV